MITASTPRSDKSVALADTSLKPVTELKQSEQEKAALEFETVFVATVLKDAGLGKALLLSGGQEMEAFVSIYLEKLAEDIVKSGGFGISNQLLAQQNYAQIAEETTL